MPQLSRDNGSTRVDKKPSVEELRRLAEKLSKAVIAAGVPEKKQPVRDLMVVADLAELARTLSRKAIEIGEPEASILFRMASIQLSGNDRKARSHDVLSALRNIEDPNDT